MWNKIKQFFQSLTARPEDLYLAQAVDLADFEQRQRRLGDPRDRLLLYKHWY